MTVLLAVAALVGGAWGVAARSVVRAGRYRRPGDRPGRRQRWAPLAGVLAGVASTHLAAPLPLPARLAVAAATAVLLLLALVDADVHRLPDALTRPLAVGLLGCAATASVVQRSPAPVVHALAGGLALYLAFWVLALVGSGLGYGDVKLAAAVGCGLGALGPGPVVAFPVVAFVLAGLGALGLLATGRAGRRSHLALGPALAAGAVLALAWA